jgi:hypothetical protein
MTRSTLRRGAAAALVACLALGACGDDDAESSSSDTEPAAEEETTTTTEATTTTVDAAAAEAEISEKTTEFFRLVGTGAFEEAVVLLENGADYVDELEHCRDLVNGATVEMQTVAIDGETATTTYDILINGAVVLEGSGGSAVLQDDGSWLVGENTFLSLYDAAKDSCTGPPPAAS